MYDKRRSNKSTEYGRRMAIKALEQEPCGGCVSREQLKRELHAQMAVNAITKETAEDMLNHLPSVTPQPKTGHWIATGDYFTGAYGSIDYVECSCCGYESLEEGHYCPFCGARMED
jgi:hypothetical protein